MINYNQKKYIEEVEEQFKIEFNKSYDLLFSEFHTDGYDGNCWIIFYDYNTHKMYEVLNSHDSTDGFAGNWKPEEVTKEEIIYRIENKGHNTFDKQKILNALNSINDNLEFDFDNIPSPKKLAEITNLERLEANENIIQNKEHFISYLKKEIVSNIKKSVFGTDDTASFEIPVPLTIVAGAIAQHNPTSLIPYLNNTVEPIIDVLRKEDWEIDFKIEQIKGHFYLNVVIQTPYHLLKEDNTNTSTKSKKNKPH